MRRGFYWWDDAVEEANRLAAQSGHRFRVYWRGGSNPWTVAPSLRVVQAREVPC